MLVLLSKLKKDPNLILQRLTEDLDPQDWMPDHQFVFRSTYAVVKQCRHIIWIIHKSYRKYRIYYRGLIDNQHEHKVKLTKDWVDFLFSVVLNITALFILPYCAIYF